MSKESVFVDNNFKTSTLDDKISEMNNGLLSDIKFAKEKKGEIKMNDPIIFHNTSETSLKGIIEESPLSENFFSELNINLLQQWLRYEIYKKKIKL